MYLLFPWCIGLATGFRRKQFGDGVLTSVANIGGIFSMLMLARTGHLAGIDIVISPHLRRVAWLVAAIIAGAASGSGMVRAVGRLVNGNLAAIVSIASRTGDIFGFVLIAPLLLTALALRQGLLVWPKRSSPRRFAGSAPTQQRDVGASARPLGPLYDVFRFRRAFRHDGRHAQRWVIDAREL
jgi:hypothetical protein